MGLFYNAPEPTWGLNKRAGVWTPAGSATAPARTHHVPEVVGGPVDGAVHAADQLQVLGFDRALVDEEDDERRRHERHGADGEDRDQHVRALLAAHAASIIAGHVTSPATPTQRGGGSARQNEIPPERPFDGGDITDTSTA